MTDIVERLQDATDRDRIDDAISEITSLRAEIERLRAALELWHLATNINITMEGPQYMGVSFILGRQAWERTRAALGGENG